MGHYPIKCIHCMREVMMDERQIKLDPEDIKAFDVGLSASGDSDIDIMGLGLRDNNKKMLYKSIAQLRSENKISNESNVLDVKVSKEFLGKNAQEYGRPFLQSIDVTDLEINGKPMSGRIKKFYCPHCHSELIPLAGKMPMYLVSLMGPSSAGKTVYLTILHMLLSGRLYNLPQGCLSFDNIGAMGKEFGSYALNIRRNNELPATTTENRKDPYLLKISYKADPSSATTNKQCLLGLIDMRGEMLLGEHNEELSDFNVPQFKEADGFIMMVDPETLEGVYNRLPEQLFGGRKIEVLDQTISSMKEAIMECITAEMGKIRKPSVVALAKQDILLKYHAQLGIPLTQQVIAPQFRPVPGTFLGQTYYEPMNRSTRDCIRYLSGSFTSFLDDTFSKPYFMSLSALGSYVQIAGNRIDNFEKIRPVRVEEPLLRLLMNFDFIPPFYLEEYFVDPNATMAAWAEQYAEKWEGLESSPFETDGKKRKWGKHKGR